MIVLTKTGGRYGCHWGAGRAEKPAFVPQSIARQGKSINQWSHYAGERRVLVALTIHSQWVLQHVWARRLTPRGLHPNLRPRLATLLALARKKRALHGGRYSGGAPCSRQWIVSCIICTGKSNFINNWDAWESEAKVKMSVGKGKEQKALRNTDKGWMLIKQREHSGADLICYLRLACQSTLCVLDCR